MEEESVLDFDAPVATATAVRTTPSGPTLEDALRYQPYPVATAAPLPSHPSNSAWSSSRSKSRPKSRSTANKANNPPETSKPKRTTSIGYNSLGDTNDLGNQIQYEANRPNRSLSRQQSANSSHSGSGQHSSDTDKSTSSNKKQSPSGFQSKSIYADDEDRLPSEQEKFDRTKYLDLENAGEASETTYFNSSSDMGDVAVDSTTKNSTVGIPNSSYSDSDTEGFDYSSSNAATIAEKKKSILSSFSPFSFATSDSTGGKIKNRKFQDSEWVFHYCAPVGEASKGYNGRLKVFGEWRSRLGSVRYLVIGPDWPFALVSYFVLIGSVYYTNSYISPHVISNSLATPKIVQPAPPSSSNHAAAAVQTVVKAVAHRLLVSAADLNPSTSYSGQFGHFLLHEQYYFSKLVLLLLFLAAFASLSLSFFADPGLMRRYHYARNLSWTYCEGCQSFRPPKTVHCHICQICIADYHHHCTVSLLRLFPLFCRLTHFACLYE
jgi:hypothetical protein